tara:strand:- start:164 stop:781 length:618 start_codon:yes stop_codon:yes gene_type:complete
MKNLMPKSKREQMLLVLLIFSAVISCYVIFRVQAMNFEILVLDEELVTINNDLDKFKVLILSKVKVVDLKAELEDIKNVISGELVTVSGFEDTFIDLTQNDAIATVREEITRLCDGEKLRILSINRSDVELTSLAKVKTAESDQVLARPQFTIKLRGEFEQLKSLLYQIKNLPYMVVVTKISINSESTDITNYQSELTASLTFAF